MGTYCLSDMVTREPIRDREPCVSFWVEYARHRGVPIGAFSQFRLTTLPIAATWNEDACTLDADDASFASRMLLTATGLPSISAAARAILDGRGQLRVAATELVHSEAGRLSTKGIMVPADWQIAVVKPSTLVALQPLSPRRFTIEDMRGKLESALASMIEANVPFMQPSSEFILSQVGAGALSECLGDGFDHALHALMPSPLRDVSTFSSWLNGPEFGQVAEGYELFRQFRDGLAMAGLQCHPSAISHGTAQTASSLNFQMSLLGRSLAQFAAESREYGRPIPEALVQSLKGLPATLQVRSRKLAARDESFHGPT